MHWPNEKGFRVNWPESISMLQHRIRKYQLSFAKTAAHLRMGSIVNVVKKTRFASFHSYLVLAWYSYIAQEFSSFINKVGTLRWSRESAMKCLVVGWVVLVLVFMVHGRWFHGRRLSSSNRRRDHPSTLSKWVILNARNAFVDQKEFTETERCKSCWSELRTSFPPKSLIHRSHHKITFGIFSVSEACDLKDLLYSNWPQEF